MGSENLFAPLLGLRRGCALCPRSFEQDASRFISGVLRHQLAPEGLCEHRLVQLIYQSAGTLSVCSKTVDPIKRYMQAIDNCILFNATGKRNWRVHDPSKTNIALIDSAGFVAEEMILKCS